VAKYRYFKDSEVEGLVHDFVKKLDDARGMAGIPFVITSGKRTKAKNASVIGAVANSAHLKGLAVDLRVRSTREVALILDACYEAGIKRRGIYVNEFMHPIHLHVDDDSEKVSPVIFIKREEN
jgi:uncharacterized protein YcbK (DUF882 family)